jgi:glycosyltransferase involved in cell wall biosynthesis
VVFSTDWEFRKRTLCTHPAFASQNPMADPKPLNLLRVITRLPVGGIERKILAVLPRLNPEKFRPRLVCIHERGALADELEASGVPVDLCPMSSRLSPSGIYRLAALMRKHEIHVVHAHMYRSAIPATIAARFARVPVVITQVHNVGTWETRRQRWLDSFLCRWRSAVIAVSESVRHDVLQNLAIPENKVRVIHNGVDVERFTGDFASAESRQTARVATRAALGLQPDDVVIVYHGRLVDQKNPEALVKIASEVAQRRKGVVVLVVGDGPCRADLEQSAANRKVSHLIRFLGRRDDIPELLRASDIYVLPSFREGFSNALIEALAAGLPAVATDVGGNAEAVEHGRSGWIVPPRNDALFLSAVAGLVDNSAERAGMSAEARKRAAFFSIENMIANVEALYTELADTAAIVRRT